MNKEKELKSLTWKYFWEQKVEEIGKAILFVLISLLIISAVVVIPYLLGHFIGDNVSELCSEQWDYPEDCEPLYQWFEGFLYLILPALPLFLLWVWIDDNWRKAKKRATKEMVTRRRKK